MTSVFDEVRPMTNTETIAEILQEGYGDASQGILDFRVAATIEQRLLEQGWAPPEAVRMLVHAAGGKVLVSPQTMTDPPPILERRPVKAGVGGYVFTTRYPEGDKNEIDANRVPGHTLMFVLHGRCYCSCTTSFTTEGWVEHIVAVTGARG